MKRLLLAFIFFIFSGLVSEAQENAGRLEVYPNPVQSTLYLHDTTGITSFVVYNTHGATVRMDDFSHAFHTIKLNISMIPNGTYYVMLNQGTSRQSLKKFVKM